jgi:hypothetical protein
MAVLVLLLAAACASGPQKIAGNYGVVIDPLMTESERRAIPSVGDSITRALADRLEHLTVVRSPLATGYDAVIVIRVEGVGTASAPTWKDAIAGGIEVARVVVKDLATPPAVRSR